MITQFKTVSIPASEDVAKRISLLRKEGWALIRLTRGYDYSIIHISRVLSEKRDKTVNKD